MSGEVTDNTLLNYIRVKVFDCFEDSLFNCLLQDLSSWFSVVATFIHLIHVDFHEFCKYGIASDFSIFSY